jgi:hypothetical protein
VEKSIETVLAAEPSGFIRPPLMSFGDEGECVFVFIVSGRQ